MTLIATTILTSCGGGEKNSPTEEGNWIDYRTYTFTMEDAVNAYEIALSQYNSFVTVINNEVNTVLDIVCAARADFSVHQPVVALFKKIYD